MANRIILNETSYFGWNSRENLVPEIRKRKFKRILVVTDKTLMGCGVTKKVLNCLDEGGISYRIFDNVKPNPTITNCHEGIMALEEAKADAIVAVGGGSVIDTAKCLSIVNQNPEYYDINSLEGAVETENKGLPLIALPTTAGTAAEVTINYVITAGLDALTHAMEGYITKAAWEMTDMFHLKSMELTYKNLANAVNKDQDAMEKMALSQYIAGMGFSNVGLGIVHSMAHQLGATYDVAHGIACSLFLPYVLEWNGEVAKGRFRKMAQAFDLDTTGKSDDECVKIVVDAIGISGIKTIVDGDKAHPVLRKSEVGI